MIALCSIVGCAACGGAPVDAAPAPASPPTVASAAPAVREQAPPPPPKAVDAAAPAAPPDAPPPPIPKGTAVLVIGDSFALAGFTKALKPRMKELGARYEVRAETSSFTTTWANKVELLVANTQPDLVIVTLGANEMQNIEPTTHAFAVRKIAQSIGGRPCVWVSPPLWKKDTGMMNVLRENSAPCRFFDSDVEVKEPIPRQGDHVHPTDKGGAIWADAFWAWLERERAPADPSAAGRSPWTLKPAAPGEHDPR
ncbi:MAG TPA: SGNH/GDSL hydrolase family protein [Byssovorax sp.]